MVPLQKYDIEQIEKIQRRATKLVISLKKLPYKECLLRLNLYTLKYRRLRGDMIKVFKIVHNVYDNRVAPLLSYNNTYVTRGNKFKLQNHSFNHNFRKKFLFCKNRKYMEQFTKLCRIVISSVIRI